MPITRLAPSPTGALHLGNARTFLVNWLLARQLGWRIILRIEDLDGPRTKRGADRQAIEDLHWLGIDWDEGPIFQSTREKNYEAVVKSLLNKGLAYACVCSRREVETAASGRMRMMARPFILEPAGADLILLTMHAAAGKTPAIRFAVPSGICEFDDAFAGHQQFDVARQLGDFVIAKADGTAAYQLAVVVDDLEMGITDIVRGDDLLDSTPRQILVYHALGRADRIPRYFHLPLVVGTDGRRLAKRHGDTRLSYYRDQGVPASRILQLLARWCGIEALYPISGAPDLVKSFQVDRIPGERIMFSAEDDRWLRESRD